MSIQPWIESAVIATAGDELTNVSFRGFHVLEEATISSITVENVYDGNGDLITSLPTLGVGVPFYGKITAITVSSGTIELW